MAVSNEGGGQLTSPYEPEFADYQGNKIRFTFNFNVATRAMQASSVFRDADCVFTRVLIGLGTDGSPDSTTKSFTVPAGTTTVTANQLRNRGFDTIDDILALQITAA